jgi:hypothetical protein
MEVVIRVDHEERSSVSGVGVVGHDDRPVEDAKCRVTVFLLADFAGRVR